MKNTQTRAQIIGSKIKEARMAMGYSQAKLAEFLEFESAVAISLIEAGERKINVENLEKIAEFLHRDIKFFLGEDYKKPDITTVLRSSGDLSKADQDAILNFIEFTKSQNAKRK